MRFLKCFVILLLFINFCFAKKLASTPAKLKTDSSAVAVRNFDAAALKNFSHQPEFNYHEDAVDNSWWIRFWRWVWSLFKFKPSNGHLSNFWFYLLKGIKYFFILAGLAALVFIILKLAGINLSIFRKRPAPIPYSEFFENIHEIDFDTEIENAVDQQNYRLAVRLLYLKSLKKLSDLEWISWQIDKTNSNYIDEIANEQQKTFFRRLTTQFEYVWYGHFIIDKQIYQRINGLFNEFNSGVA